MGLKPIAIFFGKTANYVYIVGDKVDMLKLANGVKSFEKYLTLSPFIQ